jgi:hypothetical protein
MEQEHPAVMGYIRTLEEALSDLSREQRDEIVGEIRDFWSARDKALGTLAVPGGLALPLLLGALLVAPPAGPLALAYMILAVAVILPLFTAYYPGRKIARSRRAAGGVRRDARVELAALPLRVAFLEERRHALDRVFGLQGDG